MIDTIDVLTLKNKIDNKEEFLLIDVREPSEWDEGHIEQALNRPKSTFSNFIDELKSHQNKNIILQCRSGKRSLDCALVLQDEGFENLYNLDGGILAWQEEGLAIVK